MNPGHWSTWGIFRRRLVTHFDGVDLEKETSQISGTPGNDAENRMQRKEVLTLEVY